MPARLDQQVLLPKADFNPLPTLMVQPANFCSALV
jgi:hypothetical protein